MSCDLEPQLSRDSKEAGRGQFPSIVAANVALCREHYRLVLRVERFPSTRPGQFIQIGCRQFDLEYGPECEFEWREGERLTAEGQELMTPLALLRRPFSLAGRRDVAGAVELDVIHRVVGVGTNWLAGLRAGDSVNVLGPLGNQFQLPAEGGSAILVGGGVGIPPMLYLGESLAGKDAVVFCGALSRDLLPLTILGESTLEPTYCLEEFSRHGVRAVVTTDDGTFGSRGLVTEALEGYLNRTALGSRSIIYTCGPEGMMKRVAEIAAKQGIECQVAVERAMACGMGTCQSCVIRVKKIDPDKPPLAGREWAYRLTCTDGPIFRGAELLW